MFDYENKYLSKGYKLIAGIDEAGRGPLAGPVCVAMVIMPLDKDSIIEKINDSKKLTEKMREKLYDEIIYKGEKYYVISNSGGEKSYVTLLKDEPLSIDDIKNQ